MKGWLIFLLLMVSFTFSFITGCVQQQEGVKEPFEPAYAPLSADERQQRPEQAEPEVKQELPVKAVKAMTFEVKIPENTPEGDTIWVYVRQLPYMMEKIKELTYSITLNETQLFGKGYMPQKGNKIQYRYSRNGYEFRTAEYLAPTPEEPDRDTSNYFWTKHGRETAYEAGKIQQDAIERWRWFPKEGMITRTTSLEPSGKFLPRVNDIKFRSGQTIEDLYVPAFHGFFNLTAKHMKKQGYTWVEIDPPWQWIEANGLPAVSNEIAGNPNYPDDETFLEEVRAYKQEGFKVHIAPQLCCTSIDATNRPEEWWRAYFDETKRFLVYFAELAQQADADAFSYAVTEWDDEKIPLIVEQEWRKIFGSIKEVFDGEVGEMVWVLGPEVSSSPTPVPDAQSIKWADKLDFILVHSDFPLSEKDNPTDKELKEGADAILDGIKVLYEEFDKPIILRNGYFNVKYSWKGQTFYSISSIPWISDPEEALKKSKYEFDTDDHARTINAQFRAIAERPWVIGYFHFGYTHWEDHLSPWMSVRGKPAEDIWRKWDEAVYGK